MIYRVYQKQNKSSCLQQAQSNALHVHYKIVRREEHTVDENLHVTDIKQSVILILFH